MIGRLLFPLLSLAGVRFVRNAAHSSTTNTINALFGRMRHPWIGSVALFGTVAFGVLIALFFAKRGLMTHDIPTRVFVFIAASWACVGPALLWWFETETIVRFRERAVAIIEHADEATRFETRTAVSLLGSGVNRAFMVGWVLAIATLFAVSMNFSAGLGIETRRDVWWFVLLLGAAALSYYTAYGFLVVIKAFNLIRHISRTKLKFNPYHQDGTGGLNFIVSFSATVGWMFSTGILFLPLLVKLADTRLSAHDALLGSIMVIYLGFVLFPFLYAVYQMHLKIMQEKAMMSQSARSWLSNSTSLPPDAAIADPHFLGWSMLYQNISQVANWPFNLKNSISIAISCALPLVYFVIRLRFEGFLHAGLGQ